MICGDAKRPWLYAKETTLYTAVPKPTPKPPPVKEKVEKVEKPKPPVVVVMLQKEGISRFSPSSHLNPLVVEWFAKKRASEREIERERERV